MTEEVLAATDVSAGYFGRPVVSGLNLNVHRGEVVALLGANGAGKSTTILTLAGDLKPMSGTITFAGDTRQSTLSQRASHGLALITDDRAVFPQLTALENLRVGRCNISLALDLFPELQPLLRRRAGLLSGGEQGMLTVARALARRPTVLLADELSLGLAPMIVKRLHAALRSAADELGVACLIVEQHVSLALQVADRAYVMNAGRVVLEGEASELLSRIDELEQAYLTTASA
jgi:branched-chain amino acid transport system ATP-binding protein